MSLDFWLPVLIVLCAFVTSLLIFCVSEEDRELRTGLNLAGAGGTFVLVLIMLWGVYHEHTYEARIPLLPGHEFVLRARALSVLFSLLSASLWLVTTIYAIGYLEDSPNRRRFFGFFGICVSATLGVALAGNLITFIVFYELLTLSTYPLVVHRGTDKALRAGRIYLAYALGGGAALLLGSVWLSSLVGPVDFSVEGGLKAFEETHRVQLIVIFVLLIGGLGVKAALFPLHGWLPLAMVAPAPVSALLHAVAVVKSGAFGIVRVVYDVYGAQTAEELGLLTPLALLAGVTIIYGSVRALYQDDLKRRLAYSTVSQVSYIALGTALIGPVAAVGGIVHLVHQGVMKITLFFCAGNFAETLGIHKISEMSGVGKRMPLTTAAFTIGALGMIGVPPLSGFISKWYLGMGAVVSEQYWAIAVLAGSSLLNAAYFLPILHAAWFKAPAGSWPSERHFGSQETSWLLLAPPILTAVLALGLGLFANLSFSPLRWAQLVAAREFGQ
ncbi:MAG: complex I subunit 5 family protein [Pseudomonadales bacterium]